MKVQTFSILVGSSACNARCPYCVSKMTPNEMGTKPPPVNWDRFSVACRLAERAGATTAMLTGKGEPTLFPGLITEYLTRLERKFPLVELQTNGLTLAKTIEVSRLTEWYMQGLTTVALSVAHWAPPMNKLIYGDAYEIDKVVAFLHRVGFSVRLCCSMVKGLIDSVESMLTMTNLARTWKVEQITFTPINAPERTVSAEVKQYVNEHRIDPGVLSKVQIYIETRGDLLIELAHGARVYDVEGQNVCLNNCLSKEAMSDKSVMRNLIFHPDGAIRFDWAHEGSRIL